MIEKSFFSNIFRRIKKDLVLYILGLILVLTLFLLVIYRDKFNNIKVDITRNKVYSLTSDNIKKIENVHKKINVYYIGELEREGITSIIKKITDINPNIVFIGKLSVNKGLDATKIYITNIAENEKKTAEELKKENKKMYIVDVPVEGVSFTNNAKDILYSLEQEIVNGIVAINRDERIKVGVNYPKSTENDKEFGSLIELLKVKALEGEYLDIEKEIPKDLKTIFVLNVKKDLTENAVKNINEYIKTGGRVFFSASNNFEKDKYTDLKNIDNFLKEYNVKFEKGIVLDEQPNIIYSKRALITKLNDKSIYTKNLVNYSEKPIFVHSSDFSIIDEKDNKNNIEILAKTSDKSSVFSEVDKKESRKDNKEKNIMLKITKKDDSNKGELILLGTNSIFMGATSYEEFQNNVPPLFFAGNRKFILNLINIISGNELDEKIKNVSETSTTKIEEEIMQKYQNGINVIAIVFLIISLCTYIPAKVKNRKKIKIKEETENKENN